MATNFQSSVLRQKVDQLMGILWAGGETDQTPACERWTPGTRREVRAAPEITAMVGGLVDPKPGMCICEPAVGTAGFLIPAYHHIHRRHTAKATLAKGMVDGRLLE